ncbi:hypothetical protein FPV67DRAFT_1451185 [Lyophyllum atratum]|nr:hypothetical protein FPV67DRAFT_1675809 [Lyophyllum atratum]KAF8059074.1 hypothetical protein FPV67DRAFT_1454783 [Lyophyllum atratum]KAF8062566.1 hypothetical protein FPV67DRAFT_1452368 [Lyophyllum atratum]KAF8065425.1 hypothetical protein FPV67DRAFT_1451185 [Lyophyllum atratum]
MSTNNERLWTVDAKTGKKRKRTVPELRKELPALLTSDNVPVPDIARFTSDTISTGKRVRSEQARINRTINAARLKAKHFMTYADKFKVPDLSIDDLSDKVPSGPLQEICDDFLGPSHPAQVFSAQYFDKNDKPLFFYLARRRRREKETKVKDWSKQYKHRSEAHLQKLLKKGEKITHDGLPAEQVAKYHEVVQRYAASVQPNISFKDQRHLLNDPNPRVMRYKIGIPENQSNNAEQDHENDGDENKENDNGMDIDEDDDNEDEDDDGEYQDDDGEYLDQEDEYTEEVGEDDYEDEDQNENQTGGAVQDDGSDYEQERCGVYHLVHGWTQKGNVSKGLFLSHNMTGSGSALAGAELYFRNTRVMAGCLAAIFEVVYPTVYKTYKAAFDAGVWVPEDPGPWLGRAIVYKLQVYLHCDTGDNGPAASFPCGYFEGGEMLIPQLRAKFRYNPGDICIFQACKIFHAVARWTPKPMVEGDVLTPGRISTVFFCPKNSIHQLKDKPPGWAKERDYGRWPSPGL